MVNYLYKLDEIEANHEAFERDGRIVIADAVEAAAAEAGLGAPIPAPGPAAAAG